jgi:glycosyltransferase involved in cell wall biosynthesis
VVIFPNLFEAVQELSSSIPDSVGIQAETVDINQVEFSSEIGGISVESEPFDKQMHTENDLMEKKRIVFLLAGRFNDVLKGIPDVLEAFLRADDSRLTLMVAGGARGEDKAIDVVMERYGDSATSILFLGKVEDMSMVYTKADVFILPSNSEGFPNALVEAMQRGLCCITAEFHPGVFEIIDGETNGIVVPKGDVSAIESVIKKVIEGKIDIVALGKNAKETVKKFEINQRLAELREVFDAH